MKTRENNWPVQIVSAYAGDFERRCAEFVAKGYQIQATVIIPNIGMATEYQALLVNNTDTIKVICPACRAQLEDDDDEFCKECFKRWDAEESSATKIDTEGQ